MAPETDYYRVLGVPADAEQDQIRKAFRERVRACHPDRVANLDEDLRKLAEEKMVELNEAYAVLRNPARRAAYDDRHAAPATDTTPPTGTRTASGATATTTSTAPPPPATGAEIVDPARARNRIGEQEFVARAASEEFSHSVKRALTGGVTWTPLAFPGATLALHGTHGRKNFYFVLHAAPQLDDKQLRRFLKGIESYAAKLKSRLFGQQRLYAFAAAVEFLEQERLRSALGAFNRRHGGTGTVGEATLIDLVNWHVVPGETGLQVRLENLVRGR